MDTVSRHTDTQVIIIGSLGVKPLSFCVNGFGAEQTDITRCQHAKFSELRRCGERPKIKMVDPFLCHAVWRWPWPDTSLTAFKIKCNMSILNGKRFIALFRPETIRWRASHLNFAMRVTANGRWWAIAAPNRNRCAPSSGPAGIVILRVGRPCRRLASLQCNKVNLLFHHVQTND